jgi:hypothetical protein
MINKPNPVKRMIILKEIAPLKRLIKKMKYGMISKIIERIVK